MIKHEKMVIKSLHAEGRSYGCFEFTDGRRVEGYGEILCNVENSICSVGSYFGFYRESFRWLESKKRLTEFEIIEIAKAISEKYKDGSIKVLED